MKDHLAEEITYEHKNRDSHLGLIGLDLKYNKNLKEIAEAISPCKRELIITWAESYCHHISIQTDTPFEEVMISPENLSLQAHFLSLIDNFTKYIGDENDIMGYMDAIGELGSCMSKEDLPFETIVLGFHFLKDAFDTLMTQKFEDMNKLLEIQKSLDSFQHDTLATIAKEYFGEKNRKIHHLQDSRNKMVSSLVHDVRNKLSFGKTLPDLYQSGIFKKNPEKLAYYMDMLKEIMEEALDLIGDATDYGKIIDGTYQLKIKSTDLVSIVRRMVEPFIDTLIHDHKEVYINNVLYSGGPFEERLMAEVDAKQIARVFGNLFSNAVKYTTDEIRFILEDRGKEIFCSVRDNGMGMPEEHLQRVFKSGLQVSGEQVDINPGIGIDTVKRIVELHQGRIGVESNPGQGTNFYFYLPK